MAATLLRPTPEDERHNANFDALMWALATPGSVQSLASGGVIALAQSLLDAETRFCAGDDALAATLSATGARRSEIAEADYLFTSLDTAEVVGAVAGAQTGSLLYPDTAVTIFATVRIGVGQHLLLAGPGINGVTEFAVGDVDRSFWQARAAANRYPLGWDIFFVDGTQVAGLPRSTSIEVL